MSARASARVSARATGPRYKTVSRASNAEEHLFTATPGRKTQSPASDGRKRDVQVVTRDSIRKLTARNASPANKAASEAIVISSQDFQRMKHEAKRMRPQEEIRKDMHVTQSAKKSAAEERKARMQTRDAEKLQKEAPTELALEQQQEKSESLTYAQLLLDEQEDEVKKMNELINHAKVVAIRDAQIEEKRMIQKERAAEERRLDRAMEMERRRKLQEAQERERKRTEEQRKGAGMIRQQIADREQRRFEDAEKLDQEREALLSHIDTMKKSELEERKKKIEAQRRLQADVQVANQEMARRKAMMSEMDREEDRRIIEYIREKEAREEEFARQQAVVKAEKAREVAKVLAMQERTRDVQAERDELMARRAAEAHEREWRKKEKAAAEKAAKMQEELRVAREEQQRNKERMIAVQARREREEFEAVARVQREVAEAEKEKARREAERNRQHKEDVRRQMLGKEEDRRRMRREVAEEGRKEQLTAQQRKAKLEAIKARKLEELRAAGVPEKYMRDLNNLVLTGK